MVYQSFFTTRPNILGDMPHTPGVCNMYFKYFAQLKNMINALFFVED